MTTDVYTVTLTSITAEELVKKNNGESYIKVIITATATPVSGSDGQYTADLQVTQGGTYEVLVTMENASTDADSEISTIVSDNLTLVITDITTVPSGSLVTASPAQIDSGDELLYRFRSRLADGTLTTVTTDNWTLTFTCQSAS